MDIKFLLFKKQIEGLLTALKAVDSQNLLEQRIEAQLKRLEHEKMNILVVGEFSRGKSTFINAILGSKVLPTKIKPTTATINVIEGSKERLIRIIYKDGKVEDMNMPEENSHKFLDHYVTTSNEQAPNIEKVLIHWPSQIEQWKCVLVDTPGVNDLDETREEITYQYLSNADGCIVLLDSNQPLSESERDFIRHRILKNDIERLIFVVNKMDEVDAHPMGETSERIMNYIRNNIVKELPMVISPKVFGVSSMEALNARKNHETNEWEKHFSHFEQALLAMASSHASEAKFLSHLTIISKLSHELIVLIEQQKSVLSLSAQELEAAISLEEAKRIQVENEVQLNLMKIDEAGQQLTKQLKVTLASRLGGLRNSIETELDQSDIAQLKDKVKGMLHEGERDIISYLQDEMNQFRNRMNLMIHQNSQALFIKGADEVKLKYGDRVNTALNETVVETEEPLISLEENTLDSEISNEAFGYTMAITGGIGVLLGSIFGPLGFIAGLFAVEYVDKEVRGYFAPKKNVEKTRKIKAELNNAIQQTIKQMEAHMKPLIQTETEKLKQTLARSVRQSSLQRLESLKHCQAEFAKQKNDREAQIQKLEFSISQCSKIIEDAQKIYEEIKYESNRESSH